MTEGITIYTNAMIVFEHFGSGISRNSIHYHAHVTTMRLAATFQNDITVQLMRGVQTYHFAMSIVYYATQSDLSISKAVDNFDPNSMADENCPSIVLKLSYGDCLSRFVGCLINENEEVHDAIRFHRIFTWWLFRTAVLSILLPSATKPIVT